MTIIKQNLIRCENPLCTTLLNANLFLCCCCQLLRSSTKCVTSCMSPLFGMWICCSQDGRREYQLEFLTAAASRTEKITEKKEKKTHRGSEREKFNGDCVLHAIQQCLLWNRFSSGWEQNENHSGVKNNIEYDGLAYGCLCVLCILTLTIIVMLHSPS